ncbi:MAG: TetR/AcrR family transcriptional regulator [Paracoccaceae bacterium]|nr:TetR/AcrR family transcriptional regulator [Paracoccaceae bacterium]
MIEKKKKYHHGDLKEQLVESVRQLIESHGPDGWSIAEACRSAGVSTAAPYKHFKDREEILHEVILSGMRRMGEAMQAAADAYPAGDPERIVALGKSYIDFARSEPGIFALMFGMAGSRIEAPKLTEEGRGKFAIVIRVVAEHMGRSQDDPAVNARAYALWCAVHGHSFLALDGKADKTEITVSEDDYLHLVGAAFLPPTKTD